MHIHCVVHIPSRVLCCTILRVCADSKTIDKKKKNLSALKLRARVVRIPVPPHREVIGRYSPGYIRLISISGMRLVGACE